MLKTVKDACELHASTLNYQVAGGIESLAQVINTPDEGHAFFEKSYLTQGMAELLQEALLRLSGQTNQAVFELAQAMGGGKTHLMSALGLLARYPAQRAAVLPNDIMQRLDGAPARVAVFDGRDSPAHFLWGDIATQLGAAESMRPFWENGPRPPGKEDWKKLLGGQPILILFDELPPYFLEARTVTVGNGSLVDVLTRALSNLFVAALELPRCCVVLANLADSYHEQVKEVRKLVADVQREAERQARVVTPVSLEGSEIYAILRKRLFASLPSAEDIDEVAAAYAEQIKLAEDGGYLTARSLEQVADEVRETYPFHPSFKHLVALFKDNPAFRETRGLLQFAARVTRSVWQRQHNDVFLIGTQHLDLNDRQVLDEVTDINSALRPAVTMDVADGGSAHAESIDANVNSDAGSQVAAMILSASLSLAVRGHAGLRREEIIEYLAAPNRKPQEFNDAFEQLRKSAWYLHSDGELFYFKDTENLTKRIQKEAQGLAKGKVEKALRNYLQGELQPRSRQAYQQVLVMPEVSEINLASHRVLVVVPPDNRVPPEDIQRFYASVTEKNHLLVLSGNDTHLASRVDETLRERYAVASILKSLRPGDTLRTQAEEALESAEQSFVQALQGAYNRLFYPSEDGLRNATIENGLKFGQGSVEPQIETLLASMRCDNKLALNALEDPIHYFAMAEADLWPASGRRTPWRDVLMRAKHNPAWPWMPGARGLEQLKAQAIAQGRWREGNDGSIEKGPFPQEKTAVSVLSQSDDLYTGAAILALSPRHAGAEPRVHYSTNPAVCEADPVVEDLEAFRTGEPTLYFLAVDSSGAHATGEPTRWVAKLKVRYQVRDRPDQREVELAVSPQAQIRYSLDGTNPREGRIYEGPLAIPDDRVPLQVYASAGEAAAVESFTIAEKGDSRAAIDPARPAKLVRQKTRLDSTEKVFDLIREFKSRTGATFLGVHLNVGEGEQAVTLRFNERAVTPGTLEKVIAALREALGEADALVQMTIRDGVSFGTGFDLKEFAELAGIELRPDTVEQ